MNNTRSRIIGVAVALMITCLPVFSQQPTNKNRAPQLTTDDLRAPNSPGVDAAVPERPVTRDNHKWQRYSPEQLALSVELPGKPILLSLSFEDHLASELSPVKTYAYNSEEVSVLIFRFVIKRGSITASDLRNLSAGFLDGSAKRPGVSDVQNVTIPKDDSTVLLDSSFREGAVMFQTRGFAHSRGHNLWLVAARYAQSDESASAVAFRIINSVDIP